MILLWLKIIYYKIIKVTRKAVPGTEPHVRACATEHALELDLDEARRVAENSTEFSVGIDPATREGLVLYARQNGKNTATTARLRELIDKGLVSLPVDGELYRVRLELLAQDRADREAMELESGARGACPCGGRHYPGPDECKWCRCHDPRNLHHTEGARGIMQVISPKVPDGLHEKITAAAEQLMDVRPSAEIVKCGVCGHQHYPSNVFWCPGSVPSGEPSGGIVGGADRQGLEACRCDGSRILDRDDHPEKLMDVRPSAEIELCGACGHPQHTAGDGRCASLAIPRRGVDESLRPCRCGAPEDGHS